MARNKGRAAARSRPAPRRRVVATPANPKAPATPATPALPLSVVILAAGQGKRMRSSLPKVLQPLAGQPLLAHVLALAQRLTADSIHVVYGHGGERVRAVFASSAPGAQWVEQREQLGTAHALAQ